MGDMSKYTLVSWHISKKKTFQSIWGGVLEQDTLMWIEVWLILEFLYELLGDKVVVLESIASGDWHVIAYCLAFSALFMDASGQER